MLQCVINGILLGGIYAVIGIGMSLVFGIMGLTNLAHGDFMVLAAYLTMVMTEALGLPLVLSVFVLVPVMAAVGFLLQSLLVNRALDKGGETALLVMFGVSVILSNLMQKVFGADRHTINNPLAGKNLFSSDAIAVPAMYTFSFVTAVLMVAGLTLLMKKTNFGRALRAASDDAETAELMGIDTQKTYALAMAAAMAVAAVTGALTGSSFVFHPSSGTGYLIIAFGVVVIGGMGSLTGTLAGGIVLGLSQLVGGYLFGTNFQMAAAYIVLLALLAIKPDGLFPRVNGR